MGWGALDKDLMLITEDGNLTYMRGVLDQWPDLARKVLIWPTFGAGSLPSGCALKRLRDESGIPIVVHRDRDFMSDLDKSALELKREYSTCGVPLWMPDGSEIEASFCCAENLEAIFNLAKGDGSVLLSEAILTLDPAEVETDFNTAYSSAIAGLPKQTGSVPSIRWRELGELGIKTIKGKVLMNAVRSAVKSRYEGTIESSKLAGLGKLSSALTSMHVNLKTLLESEISKNNP
jgi:hypothetical protein